MLQERLHDRPFLFIRRHLTTLSVAPIETIVGELQKTVQKVSWPSWRYYARICLERLRKTTALRYLYGRQASCNSANGAFLVYEGKKARGVL